MKIGNIIKKALVERKLISEVEGGQQPSGQSTRSYDLNSPEDVINAAQQYDCWKQLGLPKKPMDSITKKDWEIKYRNQPKVIPAGTRFFYSEPMLFLGEKIQGESDKDNTYFYAFDKNTFQGARWTCKSLRNLNQAGTRNVTPAQQKLLDDFLATYGNVYTEVGGKGKVAKDITELKYKDGRTIWDENVGIPPKGNFVYVQETLYNVEPDQLANASEYLKDNDWTLTVPGIEQPTYKQGMSFTSIFPELKGIVPSDLQVYPVKELSAPTKEGTLKVDRKSCTDAIKFLKECKRTSGTAVGLRCNDISIKTKNINTAALCYTNLEKAGGDAKNPTKMLGGIFGPEDDLITLRNLPSADFGIGDRVSELKGRRTVKQNTTLTESRRIDSTIKKHLLESIRTKNSRI
jgi:hypothetical protein